jgi:hypothetical protein
VLNPVLSDVAAQLDVVTLTFVYFLVEAFLDMACSVAVFGGGSNKEYALHVLYRLKGNIKV